MKIINVAFIFAKTNSVHLKTLKIVSKTVFMNLNIEIYSWVIHLFGHCHQLIFFPFRSFYSSIMLLGLFADGGSAGSEASVFFNNGCNAFAIW